MNTQTLLKQISFLVIFLILSWILIHFLALFGIFLALALPLLHLVFYPNIMCFWCRLKGSRHTFKHSLIDSGLILLLTAISIPIVFMEHRFITRIFFPIEIAQVAQFTIPTRNQYLVGEIFPVKIELMNIPAAINVAQADLSFDPKHIEVVDLDTSGTFVKFFVQKEYSNEQGYLRVTGGIPNPGYRQPTGLMATAYLRGKQPGAVELKYLETSLVLANDGKGSNLLADFPTIPLIITPNQGEPGSTQNDLTIRNQIQGDKDTTVLTFTEYSHELPAPFDDTLGASTSLDSAPQHPQKSTNMFLKIDEKIISFWEPIFLKLAK